MSLNILPSFVFSQIRHSHSHILIIRGLSRMTNIFRGLYVEGVEDFQ